MDVMSRNVAMSSTLNPNAPMFIPLSYQMVEDFSNEWWSLIHSSPWFRDYWLRECFQDPQNAQICEEIEDPFLPDVDSLFDDYTSNQEEPQKGDSVKDLVPLGSLKWQKSRSCIEPVRNFQKVPKIVNVKVSPRPIQQPR